MGYLMGTKVHLLNGRDAFLINSLNGVRINNREIVASLLTAISLSKESLGVEQIVLINSVTTKNNVNFSIIRSVYEQYGGASVWISFPDEAIRNGVLSEGDYNPNTIEALEKARYLENPNINISVDIKKRPFGIDLEDIQENDLIIPERSSGYIIADVFRTALAFEYEDKTHLDRFFDRLPKTIDERAVVNMFTDAVRYKIEHRYLDRILDHLPKNTDEAELQLMFETALQYKVKHQYIRRILNRLPKDMDKNTIDSMFRIAVWNEEGHRYLDYILDRLLKNTKKSTIIDIFNFTMKNWHTIKYPYRNPILDHFSKYIDHG